MPVIKKSYMLFTTSLDRSGALQPSTLLDWADSEDDAVKKAEQMVLDNGTILIAKVVMVARKNDPPVIVESVI